MSEPAPSPGPADAAAPVCYRHPTRETYIRCVRCDRPICPECMVSASVGFQCPECVSEGQKTVRQGRTVFGGKVAATPDLITRVIVGINLVVYLLQVAAPQVTGWSWMYGLAIASGEWWRLFTAGFVHLSLVHILFNMWSLWVLGRLLEEMLGRLRFVALYAISLFGASTISYLFASPEGRAAGASGAVFGLAGGLIVVAKRMNWKLQLLVGMIGLNLLLPFAVSNIDWHAHVGGLVTGMVVTAVFVYSPRRWRVLAAYAVVAVVAATCVGLVVQRGQQIRENPRYASIFTLGGGVSGNDEQYRPFP